MLFSCCWSPFGLPYLGRRVKTTLFHFQGRVMGQCMSWVTDRVCYHLLPSHRKLVCSAPSAGRPWSTTSVL